MIARYWEYSRQKFRMYNPWLAFSIVLEILSLMHFSPAHTYKDYAYRLVKLFVIHFRTDYHTEIRMGIILVLLNLLTY